MKLADWKAKIQAEKKQAEKEADPNSWCPEPPPARHALDCCGLAKGEYCVCVRSTSCPIHGHRCNGSHH